MLLKADFFFFCGFKNIKEDILSRFIAEGEKHPETITDQYLKDIILNFLLAGKDSTANTLCWFFYMLCKNPLIQEKIAQEVIDVTGRKENDADFDDFTTTITDATLEKMQYLHATLAETLRLYPVVPVVSLSTNLIEPSFRVNLFLCTLFTILYLLGY